jgi:phosphatidylserine/phosphatidylglycerophosphate/cardiolipin synthase-like enzyme
LPSNADGALVVAPVNAFDRLIQLIDSARDSLLIQAEALAEDATVSAILRAQERGVRVQIVVADSLNTDGEQKALDRLGQSGVPLVVAKKPYMHAKAILVDGALAYVGSVNFTATSYSRNRELGLITDARDVVSLLSRTFASDFSGGRQP